MRLADEFDARLAAEYRLVDGGPTRPKVSELKLLVRNACKRGKFVGRGLEAVRRPPASPPHRLVVHSRAWRRAPSATTLCGAT